MKKKSKIISVIIPTFNESKNVALLAPAIIKNIPKRYSCEVIFVDDDSPDGTFLVIKSLGKEDTRIKGIYMYKRAGLQNSLMAGIEKATGAAIITMDADFQHPPELLPKLISLWEDGHDLVLPVKDEDGSSSIFLRYLREVGYSLWEKLSDGMLSSRVSEFRLMDKRVVEFILGSKENEIYIRGVVNLAAKNPVTVPYHVGQRKFGKSSFNLSRLMGVFLTGMVSFSTKPLRLAFVVGIVAIPFSTVVLVSSIFAHFGIGKWGVETFDAFQAWLISFVIFYLGLLGEYLSVIFREIKSRPRYSIAKTVNL